MDKNLKLIIIIENQNTFIIRLKEGRRIIGEEYLTISQNLDTLLIRAIDNIISKNRIDRLSLKTMEIQGNMKLGAVSSMILGTIKSGLLI